MRIPKAPPMASGAMLYSLVPVQTVQSHIVPESYVEIYIQRAIILATRRGSHALTCPELQRTWQTELTN